MRNLKKTLVMLLAFVMTFSAIVPFATEQASAFSGKVGSKYTVHFYRVITYGSGMGGYSYTAKCDLGDLLGSRFSYCVQPDKNHPEWGTTTIDKVVTDEDDKGKWNRC